MSSRSHGQATINEKTVILRTGKSWAEWFGILDEWGAVMKTHKDIARYLADNWKVSPWWSQTITVRYEQERGLRSPGQRSDGLFSISIRRTIRTNPSRAWKALISSQDLSKWFARNFDSDDGTTELILNMSGSQDKFLVSIEPKHLRFSWNHPTTAPGSVVDFTIVPKGKNHILVNLEHEKITAQQDYLKLRSYWGKAMDALKVHLEAEIADFYM